MALTSTAERVGRYPRFRYMGSKYKVVDPLLDIFRSLNFDTALDAFSGSGVISYALKAMGKAVTANDFLSFATTIARATTENQDVLLEPGDVELILSPNADGRNFIQQKFKGLYFSDEDHAFLDSAWSHFDALASYKRDIAIAALCLATARKQPRGVFTITDLRYDDGRRDLRMSMREQFLRAVDDINHVVFDNGEKCRVFCGDIFTLDSDDHYDLVYLDPPYAPPKDDNCYIKRYHFLEGLSVYWQDLEIMEHTKTKKLRKRYTPFSYKRTVADALARTFEQFKDSTIVLSYSTNAVPNAKEILGLLSRVKHHVDVMHVPHRYSFGTHDRATRRSVNELVFLAQ